jgi:hypothetical protein
MIVAPPEVSRLHIAVVIAAFDEAYNIEEVHQRSAPYSRFPMCVLKSFG